MYFIFQNISDNKLGSEGAAAINRMLTENRSLRRLELAGISREITLSQIQSTLVISKSKGLSYFEISVSRHIRFADLRKNNNSNNHIS